MSSLKPWISAARPRTLPLALSVIMMGTFIAYSKGQFKWGIFSLSILTTLFLQILSNFANDYGDSQNGADNELRSGPQRAVQSGQITKQQMLIGIIAFVILSLISGLSLLYIAFNRLDWQFLAFFILGIVCIGAAINYTAGKKPYGYAGLGDVSVFLFFGIVGVCGSYFLYSVSFDAMVLLPAYSCGVFSVAVLNLNNMRDILPDTMAGKRTIPSRIGYEKAKLYHLFLVISGFASAVVYLFWSNLFTQGLWLLPALALLTIAVLVPLLKSSAKDSIDPLLKKMALGTLLFVILFGVAIL